MWQRKIIVQNVRAFSLIELLLSLSLGSILLLISAHFYSQSYLNHTKQQELLHLQQTSHQLLAYFNKHIQHIGYQAHQGTENQYDKLLVNEKPYLLYDEQCLLFFYDADKNGEIKDSKKAKEILGFKLDKDTIVSLKSKSIPNNCTVKKDWQILINNTTYQVKKLRFSWLTPDEKILKIELILGTPQNLGLEYSATAYYYLLNQEE